MKKIKLFFKYIVAKILGVLPLKNYIVFESHSDFCDNSKALYDYLINHNISLKYKIYWAVTDPSKYKKNANYEMILKKFNIKKLFPSLKSLYILTRAKYTFFSHSMLGNIYNNKQVRCFLMHGTSLKNLKGIYKKTFLKSTHAIVTSEFTKKIHNETKNGIGEVSHILGYPRNDQMFNSEKDKVLIKEKLSLSNYKKIIVWMPTFKHNKNKTRCDFKDSTTDLAIIDSKFLKRINDNLKKNNSVLIIKLHPAQDMDYVSLEEKSNIKWLTNSDLLNLEIDSYSLLSISDALITDFSSVYVDYLLMDKPIAFELTDIDNYRNGVGFSVSNPLDYMPGKIISEQSDFEEFINDLVNEVDNYKKERLKMKKLYHKYCDGNSSYRIAKFFGLVGDKDEKI